VSAFPISHDRASFRSSNCRTGLKYASFFSVILLEGEIKKLLRRRSRINREEWVK
jgi:hypothetical protein